MGITINYDHPFTQEERDYLNGRGMAYQVAENDRIYADPVEPEVDEETGIVFGVADEPLSTDQAEQAKPVLSGDAAVQAAAESEDEEGIDEDIAEFVSDLKVDELKAHLDLYGSEYDSDDRKADLAEQLANVLQDRRDAGQEIDLSK